MNYSLMLSWTNVPVFICNKHYLICEFWEDNSVPELIGSFNSPFFIFLIIAAYIPGVLFVGPALMSNKKPLDVGGVMKWYNYMNIAASISVFATGFYYSRWTYDCWFCQDFRDEVPFEARLFVGVLYTLLKLFDLLDTIFFVVRKKYCQITALHVIHHSIMPFMAYFGLKMLFNPSVALVPILNSFIHTIMYYYYHLASQGHRVWWKQYITLLQIVQFAICWIHGFHTLFIENCSLPPWFASLQMLEATYFILSFSRFYFKSYKKSHKELDFNNNRQELLKKKG